MVIEKPTVLNLLKTIPSGIGLDIAKNHTGICIWNGESVELYGWELPDVDKTDYFWEYKMKRTFKQKLAEIVKGRHFEYAIVEDCYGGDNFDTVRKLLALNTLFDELIFERVCTVGEFFRWTQPQWSKCSRTIYKQRGKLKSKVEIQGILEYLEFDFLLQNKDLSEAKKKEIYFEDKCDATCMLLGVVAAKTMEINMVKQTSLKMTDLKMYYVESLEDTYSHKDVRVCEEGFIEVEVDFRHLEKDILEQARCHPNDVLMCYIPVNKLGQFGIKRGFKFYESGEGYLLFYKK